MINFAKFEIIGRIGEIDARPKVTLRELSPQG